MLFTPNSEEHFHGLWKLTNFFIAIVMFFIALVIGIILNDRLNLDLLGKFIVVLILGILYLIFISVLFGLHFFQRTQYIDREIIKEVERPIEVIVDRPVIHRVPEYVYVDRPKVKSLNKRFDFVGSSEARVYHKSSCRFSKLIKKKFKLVSNDKSYFVNLRFKACKNCIKR
ncbi:MAG: hypothetical protein AABW79_04165 [Nanoarchaeota archaeon]